MTALGQASLAVLTAQALVEGDDRVTTIQYTRLRTPGLPQFDGVLQVTVDYLDADTNGRRRLTFTFDNTASTAHEQVTVYWHTWIVDPGSAFGLVELDGDDLYCRPAADEVAAYLSALLTTRG